MTDCSASTESSLTGTTGSRATRRLRRAPRRDLAPARLGSLPLTLVVAALLAPAAAAFDCRPLLIPNGTVNRCANCHVSPLGGGPRNAFGQLVDTVAVNCNEFWGPDLATVDSDGDGRTNGEELNDPLGEWIRGDPAPGDPSSVTIPGVAEEFEPTEATFKRGDADGNGVVDISDPISSLTFQFVGGVTPPCIDALDFDDNGGVELTDAVGSLLNQFSGGPPAPAPGPSACGPDPSEDDLECVEYPESSCG